MKDGIIELPCGHHITEKWLLSRSASIVARNASSGGKREGVGRPAKLISCPRGCGHQSGVAAMRSHKCP